MKKGVEAITLVIALIIFLIVIGGYFLISNAYTNTVDSASNEAAVNIWVKERTSTIGKVDPNLANFPPVTELESPLQITNREDLLGTGGQTPKAYKQIADSMVLCWKAFDRGQSDFVNTVTKTPFCFKCRAISFSDDIKKEKLSMIGFNNFLNTVKISGPSSPTYMQYFANDNLYNATQVGTDKILVDNDMYLMMFAASGRGIANIVTNVLGAGDAVPEGTGLKVQTPTQSITSTNSEKAQLELAAAGAGTAYKGKLVLNTLLQNMQQAAAGQVGTQVATQAAGSSIPISAAQGAYKITAASGETVAILGEGAAAERVTVTIATSAAEKQAAKAVATAAAEGTTKRLLGSIGAKVIGGPLGWYILGATAAVGTWNVIYGEKPFSANVMLADPKEINQLCNAQKPESSSLTSIGGLSANK